MSDLRGSTGDEEQDMLGREALIEDSLAQVFETYDLARSDGITNAVVLLLDCEDEIGSQIARAWDGDDAVDAAIMANADGDERGDNAALITTLARWESFKRCRRELPKVFPYLAGTFEQPPPEDGFVTVVVAFGGAATFIVPLDARPSGV
jgi:hypothetical protein